MMWDNFKQFKDNKLPDVEKLKQFKDEKLKEVDRLKNVKLTDHIQELNLKCRVSWHDWDEWEYETAEYCQQIRTCQRPGCEAVAEQVLHVWDDWEYEGADSCLQYRTCTRCGENDSQIEHQWEPTYVSPDSCKQVIACAHCGEEKGGFAASLQTFTVTHEWGEWEYRSPTSCNLVKKCNRCGERQQGQAQHEWGSRVKVQCKEVRVCSRCHTRDTQMIHDFSDTDWHYEQMDLFCKQTRQCGDCGAVDVRFEHNWESVHTYVNIKDIALRQFCSLYIERGGPYLKIQPIMERLINNWDECQTYGVDERSRAEQARIINSLEGKAQDKRVGISFHQLQNQIAIGIDEQNRAYLFDKRQRVPAYNHCTRCGDLKT